jgi:SAM-dependent methyltransferase
LDYSSEALEHATRTAQTQSLEATWVRGDMRALEFDAQFDVVVNAYNSMFYWDDETHVAILRGIHRALRPNGLLWLDVYNREFMAARSFLEEHPQWGALMRLRRQLALVKRRVLNVFKPARTTFEKTIERRFDPRAGVMRGVKHIAFRDGRRFSDPFEVRLYSYSELTALLERAGFEVVSSRSCPDGGDYRLTSVRLALVARRV